MTGLDRAAGDARHAGVLIAGAGFAGLGAAITLARAGRRDVVVLERADTVGGTWRDNTYPGAQCDVPSHLYAYSFAPNPGWSRSYSPQTEIQAYLLQTAARHGILDRVVTRCELIRARWDVAAARWEIETTRGRWTADVLVSATGALCEPSLPDVRGLDRFEGELFHSSRWNHDVDLRDRRVAVIGTGASAVQIVPALAGQVRRLDVYQRTPPWVLPRQDRAYHDWERAAFARRPALQRALRKVLAVSREAIGPALAKNSQRRTIPLQRMALRHLHRQVHDPALRARLTPTYRIGCKRMLLSSTWYPALQRPDVDLVTDPISAVEPRGIVSGGTLREVDAIVLATGFHVTDSVAFERIVGATGSTLAATWRAGGMQAYKGTAVAGFPNLFLLLGPNTGLGHTSVLLMIESQLDYLLQALDVMAARHLVTVEVRPEVQVAYNEWLQAKLAGSVWQSGGCRSWYLDDHGRNTTLWPGTTTAFRRITRRFDVDAYRVVRSGSR